MLSWEAKRRGPVYCAPACGAGCTWEDFQKAMKSAKALAKQLGRGWRAHVHENLGWHFEALHDSGCISVSRIGKDGGWMAFLAESLPGGRWTGSGKTPRAAVEAAVWLAKRELAGIKKLVEFVEGA